MKLRHEGRFVIGGVALTKGEYAGLLVGTPEGGVLRYVATVEWGVGRPIVAERLRGLPARPTSPFIDLRRRGGATWFEPRVAAEVMYAEMVDDRLRAPGVPDVLHASGGLTSRGGVSR